MTPARRDVLKAGLVGAAAIAAPMPVASAATTTLGGTAPGGPGAYDTYTPSDKVGFGTARELASTTWFTLQQKRMTETYYPDLSNPASRETQLVVTDGKSLVESMSQVGVTTTCPDPQVPAYRHTVTGTGWTATLDYVTDPARSSVLVDIHFASTSPLKVYVYHDAQLTNDGSDDRAFPQSDGLAAGDGSTASVLLAGMGWAESTVGYVGVNDGLTELRATPGKLAHHYSKAGPGNIAQTGRLRLDGKGVTHETLVIGFAADAAAAYSAARASLTQGFASVSAAYAAGWAAYHDGLPARPASVPAGRPTMVYEASVTALAASEDKLHRGAFVASPSMPWAWGFDPWLAAEYGPYHLMWPRDQYQCATGMLAAGDRPAADRALTYLVSVQKADGSFPQNCTMAGEPFWTSVQLDEQTLPMVLAWVLDRIDATTLDALVRAGDFVLGFSWDGYPAPYTQQERWENQSGYSPATIAACIAGFVCLADLLTRAGRAGEAARFLAAADEWRDNVDRWTVSTNGPLSAEPYYLRVTKDGQPNNGTTYDLGDNHQTPVDQREITDAGFLELTRLGVRQAGDPVIESSLRTVDAHISTLTPSGRHWHRFSMDGYGEQRDGGPWNIQRDGVVLALPTYGRLWPLLAGERAEYELLKGETGAAADRIGDMAACSHPTGLLPEQVWDENPPHLPMGTPDRSATPLAWTHAGYLRLAWSVQRGAPVGYPTVVAQRYLSP